MAWHQSRNIKLDNNLIEAFIAVNMTLQYTFTLTSTFISNIPLTWDSSKELFSTHLYVLVTSRTCSKTVSLEKEEYIHIWLSLMLTSQYWFMGWVTSNRQHYPRKVNTECQISFTEQIHLLSILVYDLCRPDSCIGFQYPTLKWCGISNQLFSMSCIYCVRYLAMPRSIIVEQNVVRCSTKKRLRIL